MTSQLRATFELLAHEFAVALVHALRNARVSEILEATDRGPKISVAPAPASGKGAGKGRGRRTAEDTAKTSEAILSVLKKHRSGLRAEQIRGKLDLAKSDLARPITALLATKQIVKTGERRGTLYFAK